MIERTLENTLEAERYLAAFEQEIQEIERDLLGNGDSEHIVGEILRRAAAFYQADRAYIIEADWELGVGTNTYEWCAAGITPQLHNLQSIEMEMFPRWKAAFTHKTPIVIVDIACLHKTERCEYDFLKQQEISGLIAVPLNKKLAGYLGVDNPKRFKQYSSLLQALSYAAAAELTELNLLKAASLKYHSNPGVSEQEIILNFFGGLEVITPMGQMSEEDIKSALCCKLITYLYLNRKHNVATRDIADYLWPDQPVDDPGTAVKRVVYRCRKVFSCISPTPFIVSYSGGYELNRSYSVKSDIVQLEQLCTEIKGQKSVQEKMETYRKAFTLYKGTFLPNHNHDLWLMPKASYYHLLFLDMVKLCLAELHTLGMHIEVYRLADHALAFESDDNELNFYLIESLLRMRATDSALRHYSNTKGLYSQEQEEELEKLFGFST
ncbi:BTAD domain-containing putative transcriptional regulator [Anaerotruncus rubiinfantis]|uniref:BTAD domain-containing putative transcriptional regulator n=1 Tax=Anaerotruncus rubiinfantis TaxID=1720200 RepID=UPI00082F34B9|nr:BTAD domain-containing putative transcriptional regulator [Anaerotruncus rubiinfantis]